MYVRTEMCHVHGKSSPYQHHTYEKHYIDCLKIKLGLDRSQGNPTYTTTTLSKEEIIDNHISVLSSLFFTWEMSIVIFSYCIGYQDYTNVQQTTLYRRSCQVFYQALSKFFTFIFTTVKTGFQKYHDACFSISGVD